MYIVSFHPVDYVASRAIILRNSTALADLCLKPLRHGVLVSTASNPPFISKHFFLKCVKRYKLMVDYNEKKLDHRVESNQGPFDLNASALWNELPHLPPYRRLKPVLYDAFFMICKLNIKFNHTLTNACYSK